MIDIRAVIFDMDGVLTDSEPLICRSAVEMFRERGHAVHPEDFLPFVGAGENRYIGGVAEKHGIVLDIAEAKRRTYEIYLDLAPRLLEAFPGAVDLVRACRQAGLRVAVASSADRIKIDANLNKIGLPPDTWDAIVTAEDVEKRKPAPDIFLTAARRLNVQPSRCVVLEDAPNGIRAARAAGMKCIGICQTFPAAQLGEADRIVQAISDLTVSQIVDGHAPHGCDP